MSSNFHFPGEVNADRKERPPNYPGGSSGNRATIDENYIPYSNVPMGVSRYKNKLFVTLPRRRPGIPSTLNYINLMKLGNDINPKFIPYPNYDFNKLNSTLIPDSNRIISVYRTRPDYKCGRLWFIDTGVLEYPDNIQQIQQPSIWILDLENGGKPLRRFEIPANIVTTGRGLASITVDVDVNCDDAFAYIPDLQTYHLYVYSYRMNSIWSFSHNYLSFDPIAGDLDIGGVQFQWSDGIFSLTLGNKMSNGFRNAYFHPMASHSEFVVSTKVLQNQTNADRSWHGNDFMFLGIRGINKQSTMHDFHTKSGTIFYAEIQNNGIGCWNTNKKFCSCNHEIIHSDVDKMIYPSDLTIDDEDNIWVMSNTMPRYIYSRLDPNEYNFRIWTTTVKKAVQGTLCE
ncbi:L-dopachrome tautomerase yellow-f2-like isoform X2 [Condylostylus longicornis]|nr:L-dopachrome tautomerase yellow-f2-like isoform X2 [Condylostylus longicornis]